MASNTFIFIPDISGFTQFMQQTEIRHSRHIIRELLEGIIHANTLKLSVSEIEGDAVLFFRFGAPPSLAELFDQIKAMFVGFHSLVRDIEKNRVCQCGACSSASNLSLKFVAHYGATEEMQVGTFTKLVGSDVIFPHRLLKNNIPSSEYTLLTEQYYYSAETRGTLPEWIELQRHHETVPDFGEVDLHFASLQAMRRFVPDAAPPEVLNAQANPTASIHISAPLLFVYDILIDDKRKLDWVPGLKDIRQDSPINRIGQTHTCVFENLEVHFVTKSSQRRDKEMRYVDEARLSPRIGFVNDYKLVEEGEGTLLTLKILRSTSRVQGNLASRFLNFIKSTTILWGVQFNTRKGLQRLKEYCEREYQAQLTGH